MRISDWSSDVCSSDLRYLIHVAGFNLGILMRALFGCGTPRGARGASKAFLFVVQTDVALVIALVAEFDGERAMLLIVFTPERSEEHTSELQSLMRISYAVFCLKKKKNKTHIITRHKNENTQHK